MGRKRNGPPRGGRPTKSKPCVFCKENGAYVDYKDYNLLRRFISDRGKVRARRVTGLCPQHQREAASAIKLARAMASLTYVVGRYGLAGNTHKPLRENPRGRGHRGRQR